MRPGSSWLMALGVLAASAPAALAQQNKGPTQTVDAFPRSPVAVVNQDGPYIVPVGFRFVLETVSAEFTCDGTTTVSGRATFDGGVFPVPGGSPDPARLRLSLPLQGQGNNAFFTGVSNLRAVLEPGDVVVPAFIGCIDGSNNPHGALTRSWSIHGYLISIDSPRLAP